VHLLSNTDRHGKHMQINIFQGKPIAVEWFLNISDDFSGLATPSTSLSNKHTKPISNPGK